MNDLVATTTSLGEPEGPEAASEHEAPAVVTADLLVEEVSIDGMCGVY
jgi:mycofactocin precursor